MRALLYARVSTDKQEESGSSLESQAIACRDYATTHGYSIVGTFQDTASGAAYRDRPGLSDLRAVVRAGQADVIVAYAIDRLSRNQAHLAIIAEEANDHGCRLEFVTEAFEDSAVGRFIRSARAFAAEIEREKIVERTLRGRKRRIESGLLPRAGTNMYGYVRDHEANVRHIVETEATIVRQIYAWCVDGLPIRAIASRLNDSGVPPPSGDPASRWRPSQLRRMLRDETYAGRTIFWRWTNNGQHKNAGIKPKSEWLYLDGLTPPIVDRETWQAAQERLDTNMGAATRNAQRPALLRGLIYCAICGERMYPDRDHGRPIYRCASRQTHGKPCGASQVPATSTESEVWEFVCQELRAERTVAAVQPRKRDNVASEVTTLKRRLAAIQRAQDRLIARVAESDSLSWEHVEREIARGDAERRAITERLAVLESQAAQEQTARRQVADVRETIRRAVANLDAATVEERRWVLEQLRVRVIASGTEWAMQA